MAGQKKRPLKSYDAKNHPGAEIQSGGSELFVSKKTTIDGNDGNNRGLIGDALFVLHCLPRVNFQRPPRFLHRQQLPR